jgi:peptide-methionine (S)-S-oxide reductase
MRIIIMVTVLLATLFGGTAMAADTSEQATFAGGCFWCMEPQFKNIEGVTKVVSGYTGGTTKNPTYEQVSEGNTGHIESIEISYNPSKVKFKDLLAIFWENIDPMDADGQFCDKGSQYRAGIFVHSAQQRADAEASKVAIAKKLGVDVATFIRDASIFYPAEDYHQDFYIKSQTRYKMYRKGCGRDERLKEVWSKAPAAH